MAWEWRFFVPTALPEDGSLPVFSREDVYFPAAEAAGVKLRNGQGELEIKLRTRLSNSDGSLPGFAEFWEKTIVHGCLSSKHGEVQLDAQGCARSTGVPTTELFAAGEGQPLPIRVLCRKKRRLTRFGEEQDCIFIAMVDGQPKRPALVERFQSVCIEGGRLKGLEAMVKKMGPLPEGAIMAGYPYMVLRVAQKALAACSSAPKSLVLHYRHWRVLQAGDVRSEPSSHAPCIGRLSPGDVLQSTDEQTSSDGRTWILISLPGDIPDQQGWTALTKKNGTLKLLAV